MQELSTERRAVAPSPTINERKAAQLAAGDRGRVVLPHQGTRERARRMRQMARAALKANA